MTSVASATTWGSPTATKYALLIHGMSSSSHTWHRVAPLLAAQGYFVTAPNLVGHGSRVSGDYHIGSIAKDLRPYLEAKNYTLIIGHSMGAATALSLFPYLSTSHPIAIVLIDPALQMSSEIFDMLDAMFTDACTNIKPTEEYGTENPLWIRKDCIYREFGTRLCSVDGVHGICGQTRPWNLFHYFDAVPDTWKVTVLVADPAISKICLVEDIQPYPHIRTAVVSGAGHWIQYEFPEVIADEALKTVTELKIA